MNFIMHKNAMDVCFQVVKTSYQDDKRKILKGYWWNLGYTGVPYFIDGPIKLTIKKDNYNDWININPTIKRNKSGVPYDGP